MPIPNPIAVIIDPKISVYNPDFHLFRPINAALAHPRLKSKTTPMHITGSGCCSLV